MEEKLREVVTLLRADTPLNKLTVQEGHKVLAWAEANLERGQSGDMIPPAPVESMSVDRKMTVDSINTRWRSPAISRAEVGGISLWEGRPRS